MKTAYTFDDVSLVTQYSEVLPKEVDLSVDFGHFELSIPVISSPMDTVTELKMASAMHKNGGLGIIHKNMGEARTLDELRAAKAESIKFGMAVSAGDYNFIDFLAADGVKVICVDSAHGGHKNVINTVKYIKESYGNEIFIIAGNVCSEECFCKLAEAGANMVKVGVGPGSICSTRQVAGVGVPQLSTVWNIAKYREGKYDHVYICADGGIKKSGDIVKALVFGADCVMLGSLLAGTAESAGSFVVDINTGLRFKQYRGMGSESAMVHGSAVRYGQDPNAKKFVPEGVEARVPDKGSVDDVLYKLVGGVKSGFGYMGYKTIHEAHIKFNSEKDAVVVTPLGNIEASPHILGV